MPSIKEQFNFQILQNYFERDTHIEVQNLSIENLRILSGEGADNDILVVQYKGSPNLSFFNADGKLLDVDHYLPENFKDYDNINVEAVISNLKENDLVKLRAEKLCEPILKETIKAGDQNLILGLREKFGLKTSESIILIYSHHLKR